MTRLSFSPLPARISFILLLLMLVLGAGCRDQATPDGPHKTAEQLTLVMPANGVYTGAFVDFGDGESHVTYEALTGFERLTGKPLAVVACGNFWGDQAFPEKTVRIITAYGAVPFLFWSPWDKPYSEGEKAGRFGLRQILAGKCDKYIDDWADAARQYGKPLLVAWGLEMNGTWFPWSGYFSGAGKVIGHKDGRTLYAGPELYKQAYRYVIDRVRARKATNILWGFHVNNFGSPRAPWNQFSNYYPGADYVDWLGMSVYGKMARTEGWAEFDDMMTGPYAEICKLDAEKPVFVAEWGVGEYPPGDKAGFIATALRDLPSKYPRVRLAVYWHERWENKDGGFSNLRVNSSPEALAAYRAGIASPLWIGRPQFTRRTANP